jgi:Saccharopine dehydrogenase NADP binding domain
MTMRVLVLGGAGNFGARIVRALHGHPDIELIAAGRRLFCVPGAEDVQTAVLDIHAPDLGARISALSPGLVIHCVGPFQGQDYRVARAALAAGANYLDLADGREFVSGFAAANASKARQAGRMAVSGTSTLPGLSFAVLDELCAPLKSVEEVGISIAPGQSAPRGAATLAAVFSYLGRPVQVWRSGAWCRQWGWMDLKRVRFDTGTRWAALCDVPDLALLPVRYPQLRSGQFHAALEVGAQQFFLWALAGMRRIGIPIHIERHVKWFDRAASVFDIFAGKWGGMRVSVAGTLADGAVIRRTWFLTAPAMHGPEIPCMAAILLARRIATGKVTGDYAGPCLDLLKLGDFEPEFSRWGIRTRIEETRA